MSRGLSTANESAAGARVVRPVLLARLAYDSAAVRVASAPFPVSFDWAGTGAEIFTGVGDFGGISVIEEGADLQSYGINLQLSGVSQAHLALALGEIYRGRDARVWLGFLDESHALIDDPFVIFRGRMDTQVIDMAEGTITLSVTSRLQDWDRERIRRLTDEDQQSEYPGDKGLQFVAQMVEKQLVWGQ